MCGKDDKTLQVVCLGIITWQSVQRTPAPLPVQMPNNEEVKSLYKYKQYKA